MPKQLFRKKYTAEPIKGGYAIAVYGVNTGLTYNTEAKALEEIEKLKAANAKVKRKATKN